MSEKKKFLLRLDAELYDALEKWAADELRSVNGQMEYVLKEAARRSGRLLEGRTREVHKDSP
ncbi:MAG: hypothetical protein OEW05_04495 [Candidatus Aminicenantes bacterium]|nr:hypothetical protein [Candidatus Aminicenantes bacterium]